jgi:protease I
VKPLQALSLAAVAVATISTLAFAAQESSDEQAVRRRIDLYFEGAKTGKAEPFEKAWDTQTGVMLHVSKREGTEQLRATPAAEAIKGWASRPAAESWGKVLSLDIVDGKLAVAKVEMLWQGTIYVDYLSLYKIKGEWKIVSKVFVGRGKPEAAQPAGSPAK